MAKVCSTMLPMHNIGQYPFAHTLSRPLTVGACACFGCEVLETTRKMGLNWGAKNRFFSYFLLGTPDKVWSTGLKGHKKNLHGTHS